MTDGRRVKYKRLLLFLGLHYLIFIQSPKLFAQEFVVVDSILVAGNKKTHSYIIIRELPFKNGDTLLYDKLPDILERSRQNLMNTNLFLKVEVSHELTNDKVTVHFQIAERWYLIVIPELLLSDRSFNEWWYDRGRDLNRLTYGVNGKHFNLSGNNDQLKFRALGGFIPYFEISYLKPYIDKRKRIGFQTGAFYSTQRTMAFRTWNDKLDFLSSENRLRERYGAFFEFRLRNTLYHFHSLNLGFSKGIINDTVQIKNPTYYGMGITDQSIFSIDYDYRFDNRDNRQYPLTGMLFYFKLSDYLLEGNKNQTEVFTFINLYRRVYKNLFFDTSLRLKASTPKDQIYPLTRGLGFGNNLVRGYELYVIDGQNYFLSRNTFKVKAFSKNFNLSRFIKWSQFKELPIKIFPTSYFDFAYVRNFNPQLSNTSLGNKLIYGGGVGIDFITWYNTNARTYYSINQRGEKGFYFGVYREF